jgi:thiol:disulfide interchange protein
MNQIEKEKDIIIEFNNKQHFIDCLVANPGVIIIQFTATWCRPCREIKSYIENKFSQCTDDNIICCQLDIDSNNELYSHMKRNRQVNGVPSLLAYFKGNATTFSNMSISGTNTNEIDLFFNKCIYFAKSMNK